jgi:hypothetical protein
LFLDGEPLLLAQNATKTVAPVQATLTVAALDKNAPKSVDSDKSAPESVLPNKTGPATQLLPPTAETDLQTLPDDPLKKP